MCEIGEGQYRLPTQSCSPLTNKARITRFGLLIENYYTALATMPFYDSSAREAV